MAKSSKAGIMSRVSDSYQNLMASIGLGANNQLAASRYIADYWTRNRTELEFAYRTSWVVGQACDIHAEDMTREGVEFNMEGGPEDREQLTRRIMKLNIWGTLTDALKWDRLFGGSVAVMMIDGQDVKTPLNLESIKPDQFKGLLALDRWVVNPSMNNLVTEFGPDMGLPKFYDVVADAQYMPSMRIHYSRLLRFDGIKLPYFQRLSENLWGESVMERIHDRLIAFDSSTMGIAQLMYKAHLRTYSVENLREILTASGKAYQGLVKQIKTMRLMQSNEGITLLDAKDKFETHQYAFSGTSDALMQMAQQLSGAIEIPLVRFLGQSPAGLNSSGDSDLRTYYDGVNRKQELKLRRPLSQLFDVMYRSEFGKAPEKEFWFRFKPLWQITDTEKAEIAVKETGAILDPYNAGVTSQKITLMELRRSGEATGMWHSITEEDIAAADDKPPQGEDLTDGEEEGTETGKEEPVGKAKKP